MLDRFKQHGVFALESGAVKLKLDVPLPKGWSVYAFRQSNEWKYVGSARETRSRMAGYLRHQVKSSQSRAVHIKLRDAVNSGPVAIFIFAIEPHIADLDGLPLHLPLGVEAGLIYRLNPQWNQRGLDKSARVSE